MIDAAHFCNEMAFMGCKRIGQTGPTIWQNGDFWIPEQFGLIGIQVAQWMSHVLLTMYSTSVIFVGPILSLNKGSGLGSYFYPALPVSSSTHDLYMLKAAKPIPWQQTVIACGIRILHDS